jgi:hypothetical protein
MLMALLSIDNASKERLVLNNRTATHKQKIIQKNNRSATHKQHNVQKTTEV